MNLCMIRAALNAYHPDDANELLKFLPQELEIPEITTTPKEMIASSNSLPDRIHYTWLAKILGSDLHLLAALPSPLNQKVAGNVQFPRLSAPLKRFFFQQLLKKISPPLPIPCLPPSPLNALLDVRKRELVRLIGFLGLRDLSQAVRKLIHAEEAKGIRDLLTESQKRYLDTCMQEQDPLPADLNMKGWRGDQTKLARLLQLQGIQRLSKACAYADPSFLWYLSRHLDRGRGELLLKKEPVEEAVSRKLVGQVMELV